MTYRFRIITSALNIFYTEWDLANDIEKHIVKKLFNKWQFIKIICNDCSKVPFKHKICFYYFSNFLKGIIHYLENNQTYSFSRCSIAVGCTL